MSGSSLCPAVNIRWRFTVEELILVDTQDESVGQAEKMDVHRQGLLHRAFSIFIFDRQGRLLLQQRALGKYHSQGLWTNTCCGHPRPGERTVEAAKRRLIEEMGLMCDLLEVHAFIYHEQVTNDLIEHEYDHVYVGQSAVDPQANPEEALDWKWVTLTELARDITDEPQAYTVWFRKILKEQGIDAVRIWRDVLTGLGAGQ
ncbi:isopentenyl-diphosphate Delta-isomerase [Pseudomonas syringae]|nr:isopentenyl-diphosphate Delta-isomerase [Pseudomonas syringae]MCF5067133.1 isopentenyl-diphosphate Delta-isomerase [Pseudomonas syringae]